MKFILRSLGKLASSLDETEKKNVEKTTVQFLSYHPYFSNVWASLNIEKKKKILDVIASGKGVMPYEKINSMHSLKLRPEDGIFFTRDEFYSTTVRILYAELKMRDMSNFND